MDEIRNHAPQPTAEERDWIEKDPVNLLARFVAMGTLALGIGWSASTALEIPARPAAVAASTQSGVN